MTRGLRCSQLGCLLVLGGLVLRPAPVVAQEADEQVGRMLRQIMFGAAGPKGADPDKKAADKDPVALDEAVVEVGPAGTISLNVVDLPLAAVLRALSLQTKRNIVATPAVQGTVTASLHDVTLEEALEAVLVANGAGYRAAGKFIYVYTSEELTKLTESQNPPVTQVFVLNYVPAAEVDPAIRPLLSSVGSVTVSTPPDKGVASDAGDAGGASPAGTSYIVVHDRPERLEAIAQIIKVLDARPRQVLVEATILTAQLEEDNALGVDFTIVGGVDLELLGSTSKAVQNLEVGDLPTYRLEQFNSNVTTEFAQNVPPGGVKLGIIKDHLAVFLRALEQVTDTTVLANPKVLAVNKQRGQVIVGRRDGYITTTVTETQAVQTVQFLETGTQLIFRPFIGEDGYVRMELHPEDSIGGLTAANLPFEQTTEVTTNVIVKDGYTILIGGLFREVDSDSRSQVPLLGNIPVLGAAFKSRNDSLQRQEVIILLTVHIVKDQESYAARSLEQREDVERLRVGLRRGMMWHGRERLAQALYQSALEHFQNGEFSSARWDVRMALYNNPRFVPAIKLQEEIRGRREWDDDGTATRGFVHDLLLRERGLSEAPFDRPYQPVGIRALSSWPLSGPDQPRGPNGFEDVDVQ